MRVQFAWRYRSDAGSWNKGDVADLPDDLVAWLNRDSPGVCVPVVEGEAPAPEWTGKSPNDRMVKSAQRRQDREGDPGDQGPIIRADHKATKNKGD